MRLLLEIRMESGSIYAARNTIVFIVISTLLQKCSNQLQEILSIGDQLLDSATWGKDWVEVENNRSQGAADFIEDINDLAVTIVSKMQIGLDKEDDCSSLSSGSETVREYDEHC